MATRPGKVRKRRPRANLTAEDLERLRSSPAEFRKALRIDTDDGPRKLDSMLDPWQRADFEALDEGWRRVARQKVEGATKNRAWFERPRGHSKTADIAVQVSWVLFASRRQLTGVVGAADKEQARLLRTAIQKLVRLNPWLKQFLSVQRHRVVNLFTGSELLILSSDAESTYGQTPDFVICDELTHWSGEKGQKFWTALFSAAAKRKHCMLVVITNAGVGAGQLWPESQRDKKASWQWKAREAARCLPQWHFSRLDGPKASWISPDDLIEQEAMLPPAAYRRLWLNVWVTGGGDALDPNDIQACITLEGPVFEPQPGYLYLGGLDLGVKHDHSAWIMVGVKPGTGRVGVARVRSWAPDPETGKVDLQGVRDQVRDDCEKFGVVWCGYDPSQAQLMAQELEAAGVPMVEVGFAGKSGDRMARDLIQATRSRCIDLFDDPQLIADLYRLSIVERRFGFKLEAISDETGHADRGIALTIVLPTALEVSMMAPDDPSDCDDMGPTQLVA